MITRMTGIMSRVLDDEVRLQVGAIEYQILVPEAVRRLVQSRSGQEMTFHISEYLEGNPGGNRFVPRRIGFLTEAELDFFDLFCTVEKIGAKKALKAMARPVKEIADAISRQDTRWLSTLPGIGAATADQIVTSLKRKISRFAALPAAPAEEQTEEGDVKKSAGKKRPAPPAEPQPEAADGRMVDDIYQALLSLGHSPAEARAKLDTLLTGGKAFRTLEEALTLIYASR